ncbi:aminotransferase class V-fold PLP-dependent enzyme [Paracidobacterium acidisoli]|uniref:Aminotransferase class V-fold PLP-dependent enzyme n=1 Tax=Paracidobacterium acidisoli TaxID=2303751 RepID=A0A372IRJ7_9BACT|nr:aminotransferase class V-fold PLP-dependent enzyme [Paracidobacterium acidisoli]MBT9330395.1 aminotransferase class V-fold PLP-dependent enzyme [Paracidobacterium acidisoli]
MTATLRTAIHPRIAQAVAALGQGALTEAAVARHIAPLFSRVLANDRIYLANHSLGRPLDLMADDLAEATRLWYEQLGSAWDAWLDEREAFRARIAQLIGAPRADCIVPKTAAGQGLRAVLNMLPGRPRVLTTCGEFDSVDVILKQYAALGRITLRSVEPDADGDFRIEDLIDAVRQGIALREGIDLVVVSQVMFMTGQLLSPLDRLAAACHAHGARLLVDAYHAIGVVPVDTAAMQTDFLIGGSYKYLRGGPGTCFLYISPQMLESGLRPLDTGWFANEESFAWQRPDPPILRPGGDAFLEGTPPVLTWYQARSGQQFTLAVSVERLRQWSLDQLRRLRQYLEQAGITQAGVTAIKGGDSGHGAFLALRHPQAAQLSARLSEQGVIADARGAWLRLCPDCLTRDEELRYAAAALGTILRSF